ISSLLKIAVMNSAGRHETYTMQSLLINYMSYYNIDESNSINKSRSIRQPLNCHCYYEDYDYHYYDYLV
ncbi:hypothetical protein EWB00_004929, partial [Schistosoma japonicum]